ENDAAHAMAARALVNRVQTDQIILDDFGERPLDAGAGHVDQNLNSFEETVHDSRVSQIAVTDILLRIDGRKRPAAACRAKLNPTCEQGGTQHLPHISARP